MPIITAISLVGKMVICAIIACAGALWILSAWFDRRLLTWEATLLVLGLSVAVLFCVPLAMRGTTGALLLLIAVLGMALLLRGLSGRAERKLAEGLDAEDISKYQTAVEQYPENPHAHSLLADVYRRVGQLELAAPEYEEALRLDPSLKEERRWLQWVTAKSELRGEQGALCPRCHAVRPAHAPACPVCGHSESESDG
jgi:tetratricopeptide (TPR) repeat protein